MISVVARREDRGRTEVEGGSLKKGHPWKEVGRVGRKAGVWLVLMIEHGSGVVGGSRGNVTGGLSWMDS